MRPPHLPSSGKSRIACSFGTSPTWELPIACSFGTSRMCEVPIARAPVDSPARELAHASRIHRSRTWEVPKEHAIRG